MVILARRLERTPIEPVNGLVASMEGGQLELDASIAAYKRGTELMKHCQAQLADAEAQIAVLENGETSLVDRNTLEAR